MRSDLSSGTAEARLYRSDFAAEVLSNLTVAVAGCDKFNDKALRLVESIE